MTLSRRNVLLGPSTSMKVAGWLLPALAEKRLVVVVVMLRGVLDGVAAMETGMATLI